MNDCEHKHTGSCSPKGIYLYVVCMDCWEILAESPEGKRLRESCPGWIIERRGDSRCAYCAHDASYHIEVLSKKLRDAQQHNQQLSEK